MSVPTPPRALAILRGEHRPQSPSDADAAKKAAAEASASMVRTGMGLGLGTGSTATHAIAAIGAAHSSGALKDIACMASSERSLEQAKALKLPTVKLGEGRLDICLDGADEVALGPAGEFWLIKGGGGAMLRERIVIDASDRFVCMIDISKCSPKLGTLFYLPVEVESSSSQAMVGELQDLTKASAALRNSKDDSGPYVTDGGNHIIDLHFDGEENRSSAIDDPRALSKALDEHPSVRAHGLFLSECETLVVATDGAVEIIEQTDLAL